MKGFMNIAQLLVGHMGVYLGGGNVFMTQQFLDTADVRPGNQQIRGK
jgi:hypothetical protein